MASFFGIQRNQTFKPKRNVPPGTRQSLLKRYAEATLGSGNLRNAVKLPPGEDRDEWLALHTVDFYNHLKMLHGTLTEFCTCDQCPAMSAGKRFEYHWQDTSTVEYRRPVRLSAPEYIDCLFAWAQRQLDDDTIFPSAVGAPFPPKFEATVKALLRRLFRVYAHIYLSHFQQICALKIEAHLNTSYRHFLLFVTEFDLINSKELVPLVELNEAILADD